MMSRGIACEYERKRIKQINNPRNLKEAFRGMYGHDINCNGEEAHWKTE